MSESKLHHFDYKYLSTLLTIPLLDPVDPEQRDKDFGNE